MESTALTRNHLTDAVEQDLARGRYPAVLTRFAPEPNAYLHVGHAFSIFMSWGMAERYGGRSILRFDDTNPTTERAEYVDAIREDIRWLGYDPEDRVSYASDYFEQLYEWACELIRRGKAYVCDLTEAEVARGRGAASFDADGRRLTPRGVASPYRDRSAEENLDLFGRMRAGEFPDGARTLRARIDMGHDNLLMRDPVMYRIRHAAHHRTGSRWCVYPTYDWAHGQSDAIERITHSICAMEFRPHRELYDWFVRELGIYRPRQIEYPRMKLGHTVTSKRLLRRLVERGIVAGWDDPRLPTLRGLRRRGVPAEVLRELASRIPIVDGRRETAVQMSFLEHLLRERLNRTAPRAMAVLDPLRLLIEDEPEGEREIEAPANPEEPSGGTRRIPWSRELLIEREDFMVEAVPGFRRLTLGGSVRLRHAGEITCRAAVVDGSGRVVALRCARERGNAASGRIDGRRATLHWVSARHAVGAEVRLYDRLFRVEDPLDGATGDDWLRHVDPDSLRVLRGAVVEPALAGLAPGDRVQFERLGYFAADPDGTPGRPVFNRIVSLKGAWEPRSGPSRSAGRAPRSSSRAAGSAPPSAPSPSRAP